jgi:hypothetical protein
MREPAYETVKRMARALCEVWYGTPYEASGEEEQMVSVGICYQLCKQYGWTDTPTPTPTTEGGGMMSEEQPIAYSITDHLTGATFLRYRKEYEFAPSGGYKLAQNVTVIPLYMRPTPTPETGGGIDE